LIFSQTTLGARQFVSKSMNAVDDRNAIIQRDPLEASVTERADVRVIGLSLQNDARAEDFVRLFLLGQLSHTIGISNAPGTRWSATFAMAFVVSGG